MQRVCGVGIWPSGMTKLSYFSPEQLLIALLNLPVLLRGLSEFANVWCSLSDISTCPLRWILQ